MKLHCVKFFFKQSVADQFASQQNFQELEMLVRLNAMLFPFPKNYITKKFSVKDLEPLTSSRGVFAMSGFHGHV